MVEGVGDELMMITMIEDITVIGMMIVVIMMTLLPLHLITEKAMRQFAAYLFVGFVRARSY